MTQIENPASNESTRHPNTQNQPKRVTFSIDPLAPLAVDEIIIDDAWRQSQAEEPERWDGMS